MSEVALIKQITMLAGIPHHKSVIQSIGDDCAIVRPPRNQDLVFTTDFVIENRHFTLDTHSPADIGHKALARSLSDLAAMGAEPLFFLVSLAVPSNLSKEFVPAFYKGAMRLANQHKISLAGGDLAQFNHVVADVMCCGSVPEGQAMLRSAAKARDAIYVSGMLGNSAKGYRSRQGKAWQQHRRPVPRVALGMALRKLKVKCAIDVSDGLSLDLNRLCTESKVSAELSGRLPISRGATVQDALNWGEDYELLFTASPRQRIPSIIAGVPITRLGTITPLSAGVITLNGVPLPAAGFDHFA